LRDVFSCSILWSDLRLSTFYVSPTNSELANKTHGIVVVMDTLEAVDTRTETLDMAAPPTVMEGEDRMEGDLVEALAAIKCPTLELV
jgi:hypothetical protein